MSAISQLESLVSRLEAVATKLEGGAAHGGSAAPAASSAPAAAAGGGEDAPSVRAFDNLLHGQLEPFVAAAAAIGGAVQKQAEAVQAAFKAQRDMIAVASRSKKPADSDLMKVLQATSTALQAVQSLQDNRAKERNHLSMAANGIDALAWVNISPAPGPYIADMLAAAQTFGNKVLMEYRNTPGGEPHVNLVKAYYALITELQAYVKAHHTTGLTWNAKGGNALDAAPSAPAPAARAAPPPPGGPGGPPPPPSADFLKASIDKKPAAAGGGGGMAGVLAALSKGEGVTSGLKKVTDDMKTKNRTDRSGVVAAKTPAGGAAASSEPTKPPKFALEMGGKKWVVEHQIDRSDLEITECSLQQAVYVYKCSGRSARTVLQIKDKVKIVSLDDCTKTSVVVQGVVASVDIVNCKRCEIQINGAVPTLTLDNVNGLVVYLTHPDALKTRIISSKCSEINVVLPSTGGEDPSEIPVPEQYETVVENGKLVTVPVAHVGV